MQEVIAAVDPHSGEVVGAVGKDDAHRDGVWHATIHVWIVDDESRILLQQRSYEKQHFPGMWDISAAGHIAPGEDGTREVAEELGAVITLEDLFYVGVLTIDHDLPPLRNRERPRVYLWDSNRTAESFSFDDGEVTGLAALQVEDLAALVSGSVSEVPALVSRHDGVHSEIVRSENLVPLSMEYWDRVLRGIRELLANRPTD
jgi:isopentenyldiphosphate isomerase